MSGGKGAAMLETTGGLKIMWGADHKDGAGNLIVRQVSLQPPLAPACLKLDCLSRYLRDALLYALLGNYEERRVAYAEENRHKKILDRYRTGEFFPETIWQAIHANIKLTCPVCRKYNVDPLRRLSWRKRKNQQI